MKFGGKKYDTQFTRTGNKRKYFMHGIHKLSVDVAFTHMTAKKGTKKHGQKSVAAMYKEYTQLEDMNLMGELDPYNLTISQKKG